MAKLSTRLGKVVEAMGESVLGYCPLTILQNICECVHRSLEAYITTEEYTEHVLMGVEVELILDTSEHTYTDGSKNTYLVSHGIQSMLFRGEASCINTLIQKDEEDIYNQDGLFVLQEYIILAIDAYTCNYTELFTGFNCLRYYVISNKFKLKELTLPKGYQGCKVGVLTHSKLHTQFKPEHGLLDGIEDKVVIMDCGLGNLQDSLLARFCNLKEVHFNLPYTATSLLLLKEDYIFKELVRLKRGGIELNFTLGTTGRVDYDVIDVFIATLHLGDVSYRDKQTTKKVKFTGGTNVSEVSQFNLQNQSNTSSDASLDSYYAVRIDYWNSRYQRILEELEDEEK